MSESTQSEEAAPTGEETPPEAEETPPQVDWKAEARKWEARAKANREAATNAENLKTKLDALTTEHADTLTRLGEFERREQRAVWVKEVLDEKGLPGEFAEVLRGESLEELGAHADTLIPLLNTPGAPVPSVGNTPQKAKPEHSDTLVQLFQSKS